MTVELHPLRAEGERAEGPKLGRSRVAILWSILRRIAFGEHVCERLTHSSAPVEEILSDFRENLQRIVDAWSVSRVGRPSGCQCAGPSYEDATEVLRRSLDCFEYGCRGFFGTCNG